MRTPPSPRATTNQDADVESALPGPGIQVVRPRLRLRALHLDPAACPTRLRTHDDLRTTTTGEGSPRHDPTPSEMPLSVQGGLRSPVACGATLQPHRRSSCDEAGR